PVLLGHSAGGAIAAFVAPRAEIGGLVLLEGMIGDQAFAKNAAAQASPLATSLGLPVGGFDQYLTVWRARRERFTNDAERLAERWVRVAPRPFPDRTVSQRRVPPAG